MDGATLPSGPSKSTGKTVNTAEYYRFLEYRAGFEAAVDLWRKLETSSPLSIPHVMSRHIVMYDSGQPITAGAVISAFENCQEQLPAWLKCRSGRLVNFGKCETYAELATCMQCVAGGIALNLRGYLEDLEVPEEELLH
jgi:hypothetical protein